MTQRVDIVRAVTAASRLAIAACLCLLALQHGAMAQQSLELGRMKLEWQYAGPLKDTVIQRWRDMADGTVCYIYLPIRVPHTPPPDGGFVQYGANTIGSISCFAGKLPSK